MYMLPIGGGLPDERKGPGVAAAQQLFRTAGEGEGAAEQGCSGGLLGYIFIYIYHDKDVFFFNIIVLQLIQQCPSLIFIIKVVLLM